MPPGVVLRAAGAAHTVIVSQNSGEPCTFCKRGAHAPLRKLGRAWGAAVTAGVWEQAGRGGLCNPGSARWHPSTQRLQPAALQSLRELPPIVRPIPGRHTARPSRATRSSPRRLGAPVRPVSPGHALPAHILQREAPLPGVLPTASPPPPPALPPPPHAGPCRGPSPQAPNTMSEASNSLVAFVTGLSGLQLERLFVQPYCVVAILRSLQPLSRHILLRLVCAGSDVSAGACRGGSVHVAGAGAGMWLRHARAPPRRASRPGHPIPFPALHWRSPGVQLGQGRRGEQAGGSAEGATGPAPTGAGYTGRPGGVGHQPQLPGPPASRHVQRVSRAVHVCVHEGGERLLSVPAAPSVITATTCMPVA